MQSLKKFSEVSLSRWLCSLYGPPERKNPDPDKVWQYLLPAAPLLMKVADMSCYHLCPCLTRIFLPMLVSKSRIHITSNNVMEVVEYCQNGGDDKESLDRTSFTQVKVDDLEGHHFLSFLPTLGSLRNLRVLVFGSVVSDDILSVLGINCRHLQIFDCREDTENLVTDVGLAYLSQCRKLKNVYFSVFADEYDYSEEQLGFTGRGLSILLMLPDIEHVLCSKYLLRDALHFLYQARFQTLSLHVKIMLLDHLEVGASTLQILPILCPELEVVSLWVDAGKERVIGHSLASLNRLKTLVATLESGANLKELSITSYGHQLSFLSLTTTLLDCHDVILLSQSCTQLKTLVLKMHSFGFDGADQDQLRQPLFPTVEKLELLHNISVRLFKYLNINMKGLKEVHCGCATIHNLEEAVNVIMAEGGWQNLEHLALPMCCGVSLEAAKVLVSTLKTLKQLVVDVRVHNDRDLSRHIQENAPNLQWHLFPETSPSSSGCFAQSIWVSCNK